MCTCMWKIWHTQSIAERKRRHLIYCHIKHCKTQESYGPGHTQLYSVLLLCVKHMWKYYFSPTQQASTDIWTLNCWNDWYYCLSFPRKKRPLHQFLQLYCTMLQAVVCVCTSKLDKYPMIYGFDSRMFWKPRTSTTLVPTCYLITGTLSQAPIEKSQ